MYALVLHVLMCLQLQRAGIPVPKEAWPEAKHVHAVDPEQFGCGGMFGRASRRVAPS